MIKSYWDILPNDITEFIYKIKSAHIIQCFFMKRYYKKYGYRWRQYLKSYQDIFDYYCILYDICDPVEDYINYYRHNDIIYLHL